MTDSVIDLKQYKYDEAEKELRVKLTEYAEKPEFQSQIGEAFYIWKNAPDMSSEDITEDQVGDLTFEKFFDWFLYDFKLFDTNERLIEKYHREEGRELDKLEKEMIKDWLQNRYSFFEVEDVTPGEECTIRDIFTKKQFHVSDKASSKQIRPSDIIGARPLKCGDNTYFSAVISIYPAAFKTLILDFFKEEFREYRNLNGSEKTKNDYLKDWGYQIGHFLEDVAKHPQYVTPEGDEFVLARASYRLNDGEKALSKLGKIKSLVEISGSSDDLRIFSWEKRGKNTITGSIEIENGNLRIECYSIDMLSKAKTKIEKDLGVLIEHTRDRKKELGSLIQSGKDRSPAPKRYPLGIKNRKELDSALNQHYKDWIDKPLSILSGQTPTEALQTKEGRDKLSMVLSELENLFEQARKRGEPYYDVGKLRKRLKMT
jgi:hypothetical protein